MITPSEVKWGSYKGYEGPLFWGSKKFFLPANPTDNHKILAVITATEGGSFDAINAYDRCIISVGLIQYCEASYFLTSSLLGTIAEKDPGLLSPMQEALDASKATFKRKAPGKWRFYTPEGEIDTLPEQQRLFLLNSTGHVGTWDADSKAHAKLWVCAMANTLSQEEAMSAQVDHTAPRVKSFATGSAKSILFSDPRPSEGWVGAVRAAFLSFAANLPAVAGKQLEAAVKVSGAPKWSKDWCIEILQSLTFGSGITIYPERYDKIRPVIERLYGVDLPDFSSELRAWRSGFDHVEGAPSFETSKEIQEILISLGYDLGPSGADGKFGPKSREALMTFQRLNGLVADGIPGPKTRSKLVDAWRWLSRS